MTHCCTIEDRRQDLLPPVLSVYLDLVRWTAALVVVLHHAWPVLFPDDPLPWPGHDAVVVFFVLSGLVIAHATNRRGMTAGMYFNHRAARILSVAVPGLLLSAGISAALGGAGLGDSAPAVSGVDDGAWRVLANLFFVAENWWVQVVPPLNAPFWSLNFEIWYYALFGAWLFLAGWRRATCVLLVALAAGPKILLLLPVWLLGVGVYWRRPLLSERAALAVCVLTTMLGLAFVQWDVSVHLRHLMVACWPRLMAPLGGANQFVGDWLLAVLVGGNFVGVASLGGMGAPLLWLQRPIRAAASSTFSAYLYHMPLLAGAVLGLHLGGWVALLAVLACVFGLALVTERQLPQARRLIARAVSAGVVGRVA